MYILPFIYCPYAYSDWLDLSSNNNKKSKQQTMIYSCEHTILTIHTTHRAHLSKISYGFIYWGEGKKMYKQKSWSLSLIEDYKSENLYRPKKRLKTSKSGHVTQMIAKKKYVVMIFNIIDEMYT